MKQNYDIIPIPVSIRRTDGRYTYVNKAWSDMFSMGTESAIGRTDFDLSLDPLALPEGEPGTIAGELVFRDVYITTRDKGRLLLELIETTVDGGTDEEGIMCVHQDMTGIGWRMEDITRSLTRSEYKARQNMQHIVRMSRDMCEPLELMTQFCDKLNKSALADDQKGWLSVVRDNARLLQKHIQRSIDLSIIEEDTGELAAEEPVQMDALLGEVIELYANIAQDKGIALETRVGDDLVNPVLVDRARARQILVNMLDSAVRGSKDGHIKVSASLIPGSDKPLCLKVTVDNPRDYPTGTVENSLPRISMGLSYKIVRGLCGMIGGRFEISHDSDGARVLKVFLNATMAKPKKSRAHK